MNDLVCVKTVLGEKRISRDTLTLSHEHICCYSQYLDMMSKSYLDKNELAERAAEQLGALRRRFGLGLFIDCTPLGIGRDTELLGRVSEMSEVDIVCSAGFYYGDDPIINCMSASSVAKYIIEDARNVSAGVIKAAVEYDVISELDGKLLRAAAIAHGETGLPIILHTNANNRNGSAAVEILLGENVAPKSIVVGHLSDTEDIEYIKSFAEMGCYVALDRIYDNDSEEYINLKVGQITKLCNAGYGDRVLLSHDDAVFMGFSDAPQIKEPRWSFALERVTPRLDASAADRILKTNPIRMLCGE